MKGFQELKVWQESIGLVEEVYRITRDFPDDERFGLTSQLRRAAVSVPSNIAEGYSRAHRGDYVRSLSIARGSLSELQTQLIIAGRLKYFTKSTVMQAWIHSENISKMLTTMILKLGKSA